MGNSKSENFSSPKFNRGKISGLKKLLSIMARIYQNIFKRRFHPVFLLLLLAVALIIWGIVLNENAVTQRNAHYLCLECIGIS